MNREALEALREKVEAGSCDFDWGFAASPSRKALPEQWHNAMNAYIGSLGAAKALHEALLPGWCWALDTLSMSASVYEPDYPGIDLEACCYSAENANPARAWLLAILTALIAQTEEGE